MTILPAVWPAENPRHPKPVIRWGIVGTGSIATAMATVIAEAPSAKLAAVVSRNAATAQAFAATHGAERAFDDCAEMYSWDGIDAVYLAAPTGLREEMALAAAAAGKHVLVEKPFVSVASLQRIVAACKRSGVGFMDGTHFGHHPRTAAVRAAMNEAVGEPWSLTSTFQFTLGDPDNIRYDQTLEPMGAVGDVGWYNMRAIAEYLPPDLGVRALTTHLRRGPNGAVIGGSGVMRFDNGSTCTWNCGFDAGAAFTDLRLTGRNGAITIDDFPRNDADGSAVYSIHRGGGFENTTADRVRVPSPYTSRTWMFEDFAAMTNDADLLERSVSDSLRTQTLLDAVWRNGLAVEKQEGLAT